MDAKFGVAIFNRLQPLVCDKPATDPREPAYTSKEFRDFETVLRGALARASRHPMLAATVDNFTRVILAEFAKPENVTTYRDHMDACEARDKALAEVKALRIDVSRGHAVLRGTASERDRYEDMCKGLRGALDAASVTGVKQSDEIGRLIRERESYRKEFESERGRCNALVNRNAALEREIETLRGQICDSDKVRADRDRYVRKVASDNTVVMPDAPKPAKSHPYAIRLEGNPNFPGVKFAGGNERGCRKVVDTLASARTFATIAEAEREITYWGPMWHTVEIVCASAFSTWLQGALAKTVRKPAPAPKYIVRVQHAIFGKPTIGYAYPANKSRLNSDGSWQEVGDRKYAHEFATVSEAEATAAVWRWDTVEILDASNDQVVKVVKAPKVEAPKVRFLAYREGFRSNATSGFITRPVSKDDPDFRSILASEASKAHDFGSREAAQKWCDDRNDRYEINSYSVVEAPKVRYVVERGHIAPFDYVLAPVAMNKGAEITDTPAKAHDFGSRAAAQKYATERIAAMGLSADFYRVVEVA